MLQDILTVGGQVITLFLLIAIGAACAKTRLLSEAAVKAMANVVLYIATPCVIIKSCIREFDPAMLWGFLTVVAVAAVIAGVSLYIVLWTYARKTKGATTPSVDTAIQEEDSYGTEN